VDSPRPPKLAERFLRWWLPSGIVGDSIVGDAREEFTEYVRSGKPWPSGLWYWGRVLAIAVYYTWDTSDSNRHDFKDEGPRSVGERASALIAGIRRAGRGGGRVDIGTLVKDVRFGARALLRQPGSAVVSVLVLALGIGLSTFMFSVVYGVFFRGLGVPEEHQLAMIYRVDESQPAGSTFIWSIQDFAEIEERARSFDDIAAYWQGTANVAGTEAPKRFGGVYVAHDLLEVMRVQPAMGRDFRADDDRPGAPWTAILGHEAWTEEFAADPGVLGQVLRVNGEQATVIGVMPEGFLFPGNHDIYLAMREDPLATERWQGRFVTAVGRISDGIPREQAEMELAGIARQLEQEYPETNEGMSAEVQTFVQSQTGPPLVTLFSAMMVATLLVLFVACANVANLLLARASMRTREAAVRVAMGAGRFRVMFPFFAEALVLAAAGAVVGIGIAYGAIGWFDAATDPNTTGRPFFIVFQIDLPILLFVVGLTGVTALLAGAAPAIQVSRANVNGVLKDESRGSSSFFMGKLSNALVVAEVALSCALLVGAGLMTKSIIQFNSHDLPFADDEHLTARVGLFETDYPQAEDRARFWRELEASLEARPAIQDAGLVSDVPGGFVSSTRIRLEGEEYDEPQDRPSVHRMVVTPGFFELMGLELLEGEDFPDGLSTEGEELAIVNQSMATNQWDGSALGRRFRMGTADSIPFLRVIGVVPDTEMAGFQPAGQAGSESDGFFVPLAQQDLRFMTILARPAGATRPTAITADIREAVRALDPNLPIYNVRTIADEVDRNTWFYSVFGSVFIVFGLAALFMASVGLYGVLSFSVSRRIQEMGIRMALGAGARDVVGLVLRRGILQLAIGLSIGLVLAFLLSQVVGILMYQVDPRDPMVFSLVVAVIVAVSLLASWVPARRATAVDPMVALRYE